MARIYTSVEFKKILKIGRREQLIMLEIGRDIINTASSFVDYMQENYGFSKSSIWYCLNRLKDLGMAEFAKKTEQGKPLRLTRTGIMELGKFESSKNEIITKFTNIFTNGMQKDPRTGYDSSYIRNR